MSSVHFVTSGLDHNFDSIRSKITPDFLATLNECAKIYGWTGDYIEIERFVEYINEEGGVSRHDIDIEPY